MPDRLERRPPKLVVRENQARRVRLRSCRDAFPITAPGARATAMSAQFSPFAALVNVAVGGAFGAVLRYQIGRSMTAWLGPTAVSVFPWATLAVNALGSLLMGLLAGWLAFRAEAGGEQLRLLIGVGLLGGFTTFSAFSLEMVMLIQRGQLLLAAIYAFLSVALGITGLMAGMTFIRATA